MNGNPNQLFFTAGPNGYANGLFGVINLSRCCWPFEILGLRLRDAESGERFREAVSRSPNFLTGTVARWLMAAFVHLIHRYMSKGEKGKFRNWRFSWE